MKLNFLGEATEVGSLSLYMENMGNRLLFDYGFTPSSPPKLPARAPPVDRAFLSHAHVDHAGMFPQLCSRTGTPVFSTKPTLDIAQMLWRDSYKINRIEGYPQLFTYGDIQDISRYFDIVSYDQVNDLNGLEIHYHSAGHIPGSFMVELQGERRSLFTGDMNTRDSHLVKGAKPVECDNLIMEATYAGREHEPRKEQEAAFLDKVNEVVERGGKAIIPAFAVGRTQEVMMILKDQGLDVWVDGMGKAITQIFLQHGEYLRSKRDLETALRNVSLIKNPSDRKKAINAEVIITTSGMMEGGPVLGYVQQIKDDPLNAILLTGYQVEDTNGRLLLDEGRLKIAGVEQNIGCEIGFFDFSAHSGHSELVEFIHACGPENVILFHSDDRESLAKELDDQYNFILLDHGETVDI